MRERDEALSNAGRHYDLATKALTERDEARAERDRLAAALRDLIVWAEWVRKKIHRAPRMDEPNTGALMAARGALAALPVPSGAETAPGPGNDAMRKP